MKSVRYGLTVVIFFCAVMGASALSWAQGQTTTFSAMGDVPYGSSEYSVLQQQMVDHNKYSPSKFQVHVGDIKSGSGSCTQAIYSDIANILKSSVAPVYIIPGDNETSDCSNPTQALAWWYQYYTNFEQNFCGAPYTEHQSGTPENFAFTLDGVLYVGIHLVGGGGASTSIQQKDADWVEYHFTTKKSQVRAAVIFSQAGPGSGRNTFFDAFEQSAGAFGKPVLFLHGDGHSWIQDNPFSLSNTMRIEVEQGGSEDPVEITVSMNTSTPSTTFLIKRNPWTSNTIVNMPPCANAGADQTTASTSVNLLGSAVDDGDPTSGSLTKTWSKVSGPGTVTFGNANSLTTTASFSSPGVYVLRLTANDSQLQGSDEVQITVEGAASPVLTIDDVMLNEGHNGTTDAIFTVTLAGSNGSTVTVDYQVAAGTATEGDDYAANSGTLTFSGATTTQTITVAVNGDANDEGQDETFFVNLSNANNAAITDAQGQGTIVNDDAPVPPAAPTNLVAKTTGTATVDLTWSDQANNEEGYKIERKAGSGAFAEIGTASANANSYNDSGLNASTVYTYQVRAYTSSANSAYSNTSATETGSGIVASPGTNIALSKPGSASTTNSSYPVANAFDGNTASTYWRSNAVSSGVAEWLRVDLGTVQTVGRAVIRWNGSYFAKSYQLQVSNNNVDWTTAYSTTSGVAGNADFTFTPTLARYVRVYMTLNNGSTYRIYEFEVYSGPSIPPPQAPTNLAANATSTTDIALTWQDNSSDETGFKIERKTGSGSFSEITTVGADVTSYNDTGLNANTTYVYRVRATNSNGDSNYSDEASATTPGSTSPNLALNKPITALSSYSSKVATNVVDGNLSTYWRSGSLGNPPINWLRVDLGNTPMVAQVKINWYTDYYATAYEVQVSSDDVNWTPVASGSGAVGIQTLNFTATPARYVRLYLMTPNGHSSYRVYEFEVYSSSSATAKRNLEESEAEASEVVTNYALEQNYPNPFNPNTQIRFAVPQESHITIKVYALNGAEVKTLVDDRYTAGIHTVAFNAGKLPSGVYFYVMQANGVRQVRQLMLVK